MPEDLDTSQPPVLTIGLSMTKKVKPGKGFYLEKPGELLSGVGASWMQ